LWLFIKKKAFLPFPVMQKGTASKVAFCMEGSIDPDVLYPGNLVFLSDIKFSSLRLLNNFDLVILIIES